MALAASAVPLLIGSIWLLFTSPVNGLANIGLSLIAVGIGIWIIKGCFWLCRWFLNLMTRLFGRIARRDLTMKSKNRIWLISFGCIGIGIVLLAAGMMLGTPGFYIDRTGIHSQYSNISDAPHIQKR